MLADDTYTLSAFDRSGGIEKIPLVECLCAIAATTYMAGSSSYVFFSYLNKMKKGDGRWFRRGLNITIIESLHSKYENYRLIVPMSGFWVQSQTRIQKKKNENLW